MAEKKNYHSLNSELDKVMAQLQADVDIDQAIVLYKQAQELIDELEKYLETAKNKVEKVKLKFH